MSINIIEYNFDNNYMNQMSKIVQYYYRVHFKWYQVLNRSTEKYRQEASLNVRQCGNNK